MATLTQRAIESVVVTTGWINSANAWAIATDAAFATASPGKNATINDDFLFPDFGPQPDWTSITNPYGAGLGCRFDFANGRWFVMRDSPPATNNIASTAVNDPGAAYTLATCPVASGSINFMSRIVYGAGVYVVVGGNFASPNQLPYLVTASDPTGTWTQRTSAFASGSVIRDVAFGNGVFVAVGDAGQVATSSDGITWSLVTTGYPAAKTIWKVKYEPSQGIWVIVGDSDGVNPSVFTATDPNSTWTGRTLPILHNWLGVEYGNGLWVVISDTLTDAYTAPDPTGTWTVRSGVFGPSATPRKLVYANGYFLMSSAQTYPDSFKLARDPTTTWFTIDHNFPLSASTSQSVHDMVAGGGWFGITSSQDGLLSSAPDGVDYAIPLGSTITAVRCVVDWKTDVVPTGTTLGCQGRVAGANSGTEVTKTTAAEATSTEAFGAVTVAQLHAAHTTVMARIRCSKGNSGTSMTGSLDFARLEVDFTPPDLPASLRAAPRAVLQAVPRASSW